MAQTITIHTTSPTHGSNTPTSSIKWNDPNYLGLLNKLRQTDFIREPHYTEAVKSTDLGRPCFESGSDRPSSPQRPVCRPRDIIWRRQHGVKDGRKVGK